MPPMSEQRDSLLYYPLIAIFVLLVAAVSYHAGSPEKPSMPGVELPVRPVIMAHPALEAKSATEVGRDLETKASDQAQADAAVPEAPPAETAEEWK